MRMRSPLRRSPRAPLPPRTADAARLRGAFSGARRRCPPQPWVLTGCDLATPAAPTRRFPWPRPAALAVVAAGAVCAALLLVSLRMDSIRLRYALAEAVRAEQVLLDQQRRLTVQVRHLRDPRRLEALAAELGMAPPGCTIDLDHPRPCPEPVL